MNSDKGGCRKAILELIKQAFVLSTWGKCNHQALKEQIQDKFHDLNICCQDEEWESKSWEKMKKVCLKYINWYAKKSIWHTLRNCAFIEAIIMKGFY